MTTVEFANRYFAFLLSGKAEDLQKVCEAYLSLTRTDITMGEIQSAMDQAHSDAEMLCLMTDNHPVGKTDHNA